MHAFAVGADTAFAVGKQMEAVGIYTWIHTEKGATQASLSVHTVPSQRALSEASHSTKERYYVPVAQSVVE